MTMRQLPLHRMADRHFGLTDALAETYSEAARVCFDRHHMPPAHFDIIHSGLSETVTAEWTKPNARTRGAYANETDTTRDGAYACALAAVELAEGLVAVHRAETKTGSDYYIAAAGNPPQDLEECIRLEVSGLDRGTEAAIIYRLKEKLEQAAEGSSNLPAMATVVAFQPRRIAYERVEVA